MDWDRDAVTYSTQFRSQQPENGAIDNKVIQSKFRQFLREFRKDDETFIYREKLNNNYDTKNYFVSVDLDDLIKFDQELGESFVEKPSAYIPLFENAAQEVVAMSSYPPPAKQDMHPIQVQINNFSRQPISIRHLEAKHISKLVRVPGIVITSSKPLCKATSITLRCTNCSATIVRSTSRGFGNIDIPRQCENQSDEKNDNACPLDPFVIISDKCKFLDIQKLKLQESPEDIPTGEMPRHIWLFCERKLVNTMRAGQRVSCIGIYKIMDSPNESVKKSYIEVIGMSTSDIEDSHSKVILTASEEEAIRDLSRNPNIHSMIASSIAPAIWGSKDIKKALACLLFGGSRKALSTSLALRGDINVLLLGDPSVAKSQFLKFVSSVAPIAVYTSGKGSSAAGLTASVLKEPGSGEFHLAAGAMVLADGGVVCIDEFDKMRDSDRVAIHEAMEQQTISIAKAGITTILNSRASVLAAANPVFGRYDELRNTDENIDFETTILSRFDMIFIIRDLKDKNRDSLLAKHIMGLHINDAEDKDKEAEVTISPELLKKYIAYARQTVHPRLTHSAAEMLRNDYVSFRRETQNNQTIPLTVRQLESMIRIAESLAKMQLANEANQDHVKEAVRLFKLSTLKAAKEGGMGANAHTMSSEQLEKVQRAERSVQRRLPLNSKMQVEKLINEMMRRNIPNNIVRTALDIMHKRGEIQYMNKRRQIKRIK